MLENYLGGMDYVTVSTERANDIDCNSSPSFDDSQKASSFHLTFRAGIERQTLLGIISSYGKPRMALDSYDHLVALIRDGVESRAPPSESTMLKKIFP